MVLLQSGARLIFVGDDWWRREVRFVYIIMHRAPFIITKRVPPQEFPIVTSWPSGLRRYVKAVVFTGVGSNPIDVILLPVFIVWREHFLPFGWMIERAVLYNSFEWQL